MWCFDRGIFTKNHPLILFGSFFCLVFIFRIYSSPPPPPLYTQPIIMNKISAFFSFVFFFIPCCLNICSTRELQQQNRPKTTSWIIEPNAIIRVNFCWYWFPIWKTSGTKTTSFIWHRTTSKCQPQWIVCRLAFWWTWTFFSLLCLWLKRSRREKKRFRSISDLCVYFFVVVVVVCSWFAEPLCAESKIEYANLTYSPGYLYKLLLMTYDDIFM